MADQFLDQKIGVPVVLPVLDTEWITYPAVMSGGGSKVFTTTLAKYRQRLNGYEIAFSFSGNTTASGGGTTPLVFSMPSGALIDFNNEPISTPGSASNTDGYGFEYNITNVNGYTPLAGIFPVSTSTVGFLRLGASVITSGNLNNTNQVDIVGRIWVPIQGLSAMRAYGAGAVTSSRSGLVAPRKGQYGLTVTGTGWTTRKAVGIYYQDQDGNHRLKFNIAGNTTSVSRNIMALSITGVVFANDFQAVAAYTDNGATSTPVNGYTAISTNLINLLHVSVATTLYALSGDVELASKPSWA